MASVKRAVGGTGTAGLSVTLFERMLLPALVFACEHEFDDFHQILDALGQYGTLIGLDPIFGRFALTARLDVDDVVELIGIAIDPLPEAT